MRVFFMISIAYLTEVLIQPSPQLLHILPEPSQVVTDCTRKILYPIDTVGEIRHSILDSGLERIKVGRDVISASKLRVYLFSQLSDLAGGVIRIGLGRLKSLGEITGLIFKHLDSAHLPLVDSVKPSACPDDGCHKDDRQKRQSDATIHRSIPAARRGSVPDHRPSRTYPFRYRYNRLIATVPVTA